MIPITQEGRGPGLERETAQDHVSGKQLSQDWNPRSLTPELNPHNTAIWPGTDILQVKRGSVYWICAASYSYASLTLSRHDFYSELWGYIMSLRPGYHGPSAALLTPGNLLLPNYLTALTPLFKWVTQMAWLINTVEEMNQALSKLNQTMTK